MFILGLLHHRVGVECYECHRVTPCEQVYARRTDDTYQIQIARMVCTEAMGKIGRRANPTESGETFASRLDHVLQKNIRLAGSPARNS